MLEGYSDVVFAGVYGLPNGVFIVQLQCPKAGGSHVLSYFFLLVFQLQNNPSLLGRRGKGREKEKYEIEKRDQK